MKNEKILGGDASRIRFTVARFVFKMARLVSFTCQKGGKASHTFPVANSALSSIPFKLEKYILL
ncbi:MAG: hypothetical protein IRD7MM_02150 [Candidatus Midichloria mitochondrii]